MKTLLFVLLAATVQAAPPSYLQRTYVRSMPLPSATAYGPTVATPSMSVAEAIEVFRAAAIDARVKANIFPAAYFPQAYGYFSGLADGYTAAANFLQSKLAN